MGNKLLSWGDMDAQPAEPIVEIEADTPKPDVRIYANDDARDARRKERA